MSKRYDHPAICQAYFFPMPGGPLPRRERSEPVALRLADGTRIGAYWSHPLQRAPTLLYLHGNGECISDQLGHWPRWAAEVGANIFFVDYPGYATSQGRPALSTCREAARAALRYLVEQPTDAVPHVVLVGRSVGSIFALDVAWQWSSATAEGAGRVRGLVLESGIADLKQRLAIRVPYEQVGIDRAALEAELDEDFDHRRKVQSVEMPVLVLHTRRDQLVPAWHGELLARWAADVGRLHELILFENGDHNSIQWVNDAAYRHELGAFLAAIPAPSEVGSAVP